MSSRRHPTGFNAAGLPGKTVTTVHPYEILAGELTHYRASRGRDTLCPRSDILRTRPLGHEPSRQGWAMVIDDLLTVVA